jgi:hypothetical protein
MIDQKVDIVLAHQEQHDFGLSVSCEVEATQNKLQLKIIELNKQGYEVKSITPIIAGTSLYGSQPNESNQNNQGILSKIVNWASNNRPNKTHSQALAYSMGYSYTQGFTILSEREKV